MDETEGGGRGINVPGVISLAFFYLAVLGIGIYAGFKQRRNIRKDGRKKPTQEDVMVAGRDMGSVVGILTMAGTIVGGGYINGSSEITYTSGVVWNLPPLGFSLALIMGGLVFSRRMRDARYVTLMDPYTCKYGRWGALHALPPVLSEVFWTAAILSALGSTLQVILSLDRTTSIVASAVIAVFYTLVGGLLSVAYTDVFQISFIGLGIAVALPFAMTNDIVAPISTVDWVGTVRYHEWGAWVDTLLLLCPGGIPWQGYFQRVLSCRSSNQAVVMSVGGGILSLLLAIAPSLFGAVGLATDWTKTEFGHTPEGDQVGLLLPLCLQYTTPTAVAVLGLGAVSAAVMSSVDSAMLSAGSLISRNVYRTVFRPKASDSEVLIVLWVTIIVTSSIATCMAIFFKTIYGLIVLVGDALYIGFPQFVVVLYFSWANNYGAVPSWIFCLLFRILCGDDVLGIPPYVSFGELTNPDTGETGPVPFRTIVVCITIVIHLVLSTVAHLLFTRKILSLKLDVFGCFEKDVYGNVVPSRTRFLPGREAKESNGVDLDTFERDNGVDNKGFEIPRPRIGGGGNSMQQGYSTKETDFI